MIIACPHCYTRFAVPDNSIPPAGRRVRCQKCATVWLQDQFGVDGAEPSAATLSEMPQAAPTRDPPTPARGLAAELPADEEAEDAPPRFGPVAEDDTTALMRQFGRPTAQRRPPTLGPARVGWGILAACVILLGGLFLGASEELMAIWPATARLYQMAGLGGSAVPARIDLGIEKVSTTKASIDGKPSLSIAGEVANHTGGDRAVPRMRVILHGANNSLVRTIDFAADAASVAPGRSVHFQAIIPDPPAEATTADVTFALDAKGSPLPPAAPAKD